MDSVNIYEAKTHLSALVDKAAAGEEVTVCRHGKPVVRITQLSQAPRRIRFGVLKGRVKIAPDFDAPLPPDAAALFAGR